MGWNFLSKTGAFAGSLVGTVGYTVYDATGTEYAARTTDGIVAVGAIGYAAVISLPASASFVIQWDDGSSHYDYDSTPDVRLADGVIHGGTTADLTLKHIVLSADDTPLHITSTGNQAVSIEGQTNAITVVGGKDGIADVIVLTTYAGSGSVLTMAPGDSGAAVKLLGPYTTPGPVVVISTDSANSNMSAGGHGISILASGTGSKAVLLAGDAATDALGIAAGAGSPIDIFGADGSVNAGGGGGGGGASAADVWAYDARSLTAAVNLDLAQVIPTSNTVQTTGDALNAARAQGFGNWTLDPNAKTLTLFAPDGITVVRTFHLDSGSAPLTRS